MGADHHFNGLAAHLHGDGLGQLVQVEPVGDDGGEIQLAGVNQPHGPLVGVRVHEGAPDGQLLLVHVEEGQVEGGVHLGHAEQHDGGALLGQLESTLHRGVVAHALDDHVGAVAQGCLVGAPGVGGSGVDGGVGAQGQGHLAALFVGLAEHQAGGPGELGQLEHDEADGPAAYDAHPVPGLDAGQVDAVEAAGHGFRHGAGLIGDRVPQLEGLGGRHQAVLPKAAVPGDAYGLHGLAQLLFAVAAVDALAAVDVGVHGDVVAGL